ncbi:disease resistance CC-NBS-LRR class family protein [Tanacetum coccineum]
MSNIEKIKFPALDITGANYIQWTGNVKRHLKSMGALATLQEGNKCSEETKAKADVFLHQHIDEMLEFEYSNCDDPSILWKDLETRFNNQREVLLPSARDEWNNLRFQDFKKVNEYTSALFRICRTLRFCGQTVTEADMLGHPGSTMTKRIVENTHGHPLKDQKFPKIDKVPLCTSCSLGKLIARSSPLKVENESPMFLERIQGDICGLIHPPCGPFRYFMVLIDASSRWSHVSLLSTRNVAFAKFLAQIIKLRAHFPDYTVKRVRLDNAGEFTSHAFNDYCMSVGIVVEHPVAHVHTQNGLAESLIKRLQLIARPLIMRTKLLVSMWGHAILHAASLIRMRPSANHKYSLMHLASGQEPNISHLRIFGCAIYIEPLTCDLFTARFADCHFNEGVFPELGGVQKIAHLQEIANQLPDAFTDTKRVTKSHIPAANAPTRIEIPNKQAGDNITHESQKRLKRGKPIGSKDKNPRKRKGIEKHYGQDENVLDETQDIKTSPEEEMNDINKEMSINYSQTHILWDRNEIGDIDEIFSYFVASDPEPKSVIDCQSRPDWDKWKDAMQVELNSLNKRKVFGPIVTAPRDVKPIGYRWVFVRKRNEKNEVTRYLISLAVSKNLEMCLMDVVTTYLYGSIDNDIYMKIPEGFKIPDSLSSKPKEMCLIKLQRSLYGLKQSGRM